MRDLTGVDGAGRETDIEALRTILHFVARPANDCCAAGRASGMIRAMPTSERARSVDTTERLLAFSDGVFAIVITLLVIELALPHLQNPNSTSELFDALFSLRGRFASYVICFLFVGNLWMSHANFFRALTRTEPGLLALNILLLMLVCLQPFVTTILGEYPENPGSVLVFGTLFTATSAVFVPMSWYCHYRRLFRPDLDPVRSRRGLRIVTVMGIASLVPLAIARASPSLAMTCYVALILGYAAVQSQFRVQPSATGSIEPMNAR